MRFQTAYDRMLQTAIRRGAAEQGNRRIEFNGTHHTIGTFDCGRVEMLSGRLDCFYYGTRILTVDFDEKKLTDYGMDSHSVSTAANIRKWKRALGRFMRGTEHPGSCLGPETLYQSGSWTTPPYKLGFSRSWQTEYRVNFVKKVPWLEVDSRGIWWFLWSTGPYEESYDLYWHGWAFLHGYQRWRYFTYDWNEKGEWAKRFIDADAERRFKARQKRSGHSGDIP